MLKQPEKNAKLALRDQRNVGCMGMFRNHWFDDPTGTQTVWRWRAEVQQDFARRADWMKDP
jgi:hypothetical protein